MTWLQLADYIRAMSVGQRLEEIYFVEPYDTEPAFLPVSLRYATEDMKESEDADNGVITIKKGEPYLF